MTGEQKVRFLLNAGLLNAALQEAIKAKIEVEKATLLVEHWLPEKHPLYDNWVKAVTRLFDHI